MPTKLSVFCEKVIEACWLIALMVTPLFINIYSQRTFEPDKITLLRSIALVMVLAWIIRLIDSSSINSPEMINMQERSLWRRLLRIPMVLPALLLAAVYLLSTSLSLTPRISLWGSYARLQGTFTTFSYIVIFFLMLSAIRRQEQVSHLCLAIILTSVPISFFGILQHFHLDPLPWGGERAGSVSQRVVSTFGNPIFLAAYLLMVIPVTVSRVFDLLSGFSKAEKKETSSILLFICYALIMTLQCICLLFTQSRGPWLGLIGGLYVFILFALLSLRKEDNHRRPIGVQEMLKALAFAILSVPLGALPAYGWFILSKKGRPWLWLSWVWHALLIIGFLVLLNLPWTPLQPLRQLPYLGRLAELFQTETGTGKVRMLVWEGTVNLVQSASSRIIAGYGPETIQTVFSPYYPPELSRYEVRNAQVDRLHNESFDVLVTTGLIGLIISMFIMGSLIYYAMKWLGFVKTTRAKQFFLLFCILGTFSGGVIPKWVEGTYRVCGVGLPLGLIFGSLVYLIFSEMFLSVREESPTGLKQPWLFTGLFSALVGHLIEVQFGIVIASTRLYFWVYAALLVIIGLQWDRETESEGEGGALPKKGLHHFFVTPEMLTGSFLILVILFTLGFDFINNMKGEKNWLKIMQISFMTRGYPGRFEPSNGVLWLFILTSFMGGLVVVFENKSLSFSRNRRDWFLTLPIYFGIPLIGFGAGVLIYSFFIQPSSDLTNTIIFFYVGMGVLILLLSVSLVSHTQSPQKRIWEKAAWAYPVLVVLVLVVIFASNTSAIKADIYAKQGSMMRDEKRWDHSTSFYRRAISLAPDQESYYLELTRIFLQEIDATHDPQKRIPLFEESLKVLEKAGELNPRSPEIYARLGYLFYRWADIVSSLEERMKKLNQSHLYYAEAVRWAPWNVETINLWAHVSLAKGDYQGALEKLTHSQSLDPRFSSTYFELGEVYSAQGNYPEAEKAYREAITLNPNHPKAHASLGYLYYRKRDPTEAQNLILEALRIDPNQPTAHSVLGLIYFQSGQMQQAMEENRKVLRLLPNDLSSHKNLALIYQKMGRPEEALIHAQRVFALSPEEDRPGIQEFIDQLKAVKSSSKPN